MKLARKSKQYVNTAGMFIFAAENGFTKPLSNETKRTVLVCMKGLYWADHYIDSEPPSNRDAVIRNLLGYLNDQGPLTVAKDPEGHAALRELKSLYDQCDSVRKRAFFGKVVQIISCGKIISTSADTNEFFRYRALEALGSVDIVLLMAKELGENKRFSKFIRAAAVAGNLWNSLDDAPEDYACQRLAINPNKLYFPLFRETVTRAASAFWLHPRKRTVFKICTIWFLRHYGLKSNTPWAIEPCSRPQERTLPFVAGAAPQGH
jgi:hypothetical protein